MTNSEIRSSVRSKIKDSYPKLVGYSAAITFIALTVYMPLLFLKPDIPYSILAFANVFALLLIIAPLDYIFKKSCFKIASNETAEQSNPFKLKIENGRYSKIISLNIWKSIPAILLVMHTLLAVVSFIYLGIVYTISTDINRLVFDIILITLPITLVITTIKSFSYSVADYIFIEQTDISPRDAIKTSKELMKHNKMRYFKLCLPYFVCIAVPSILIQVCTQASFDTNSQAYINMLSNPWVNIGFAVLTAVVSAFITPYCTVATTEFYKDLKENRK